MVYILNRREEKLEQCNPDAISVPYPTLPHSLVIVFLISGLGEKEPPGCIWGFGQMPFRTAICLALFLSCSQSICLPASILLPNLFLSLCEALHSSVSLCSVFPSLIGQCMPFSQFFTFYPFNYQLEVCAMILNLLCWG